MVRNAFSDTPKRWSRYVSSAISADALICVKTRETCHRFPLSARLQAPEVVWKGYAQTELMRDRGRIDDSKASRFSLSASATERFAPDLKGAMYSFFSLEKEALRTRPRGTPNTHYTMFS
jgi:hypothetical protein